jgi:hypothetical protein
MVTLRIAGTDTGSRLTRGTALIASPHEEAAGGAVEPTAGDSQDGGRARRRQEAVETIHHPPMSRNDAAGVLDPEPPFDRRLEQIAGLSYGGK